MELIGFNDHFLRITKNGVYEPNSAAFLIKNSGNTDVWLNDTWLLKPCESYGLLNHLPYAVTNGSYRVKFGATNVSGIAGAVKPEVIIAEVHYSNIDNSKYAE